MNQLREVSPDVWINPEAVALIRFMRHTTITLTSGEVYEMPTGVTVSQVVRALQDEEIE